LKMQKISFLESVERSTNKNIHESVSLVAYRIQVIQSVLLLVIVHCPDLLI